MTVEFGVADQSSTRRPRARGDPYAVSSRCRTVADTLRNHKGRWLWGPAFAGTTRGEMFHPSSPSLPWRVDLGGGRIIKKKLGPPAAPQEVENARDREMP